MGNHATRLLLSVFVTVFGVSLADAQPPPRVQISEVSPLVHSVAVNGVTLHTEEGAFSVSLKRIVSGGGSHFALIEIASGGAACPAMYRVIDLAARQPSISAEFGTCSDLPRTETRDGVLRVTLPNLAGRGGRTFTFGSATSSSLDQSAPAGGHAANAAPRSGPRWTRLPTSNRITGVTVRNGRGEELRFECDADSPIALMSAGIILPHVGGRRAPETSLATLDLGQSRFGMEMRYVADSDVGTLWRSEFGEGASVALARRLHAMAANPPEQIFFLAPGRNTPLRFTVAGASEVIPAAVQRCAHLDVRLPDDATPTSLVDQWLAAQSDCRGGSGDVSATCSAVARCSSVIFARRRRMARRNAASGITSAATLCWQLRGTRAMTGQVHAWNMTLTRRRAVAFR